MIGKSKLFVVVGSPGSGKDLVIQAVNDMGKLHAQIIPKHTTRKRQFDDGNEMICIDDKDHDISGCDIVYNNYATNYGLKTSLIWDGFSKEQIQVVVISNIEAINKLCKIFKENIVLIFIHSETTKEDYLQIQEKRNNSKQYIEQRFLNYKKAWDIYFDNNIRFDHTIIYSGSNEDMYDQIFRLFMHYDKR